MMLPGSGDVSSSKNVAGVTILLDIHYLQGFYEADTLNQQPIKDTDWGFASRLPDLGQLLEQASQHAIDPSSSNPLPGAGWGALA